MFAPRNGLRESADRSDSREIAIQTPFIIFGNEFFDALPVEVLDYRGELRVTLGQSLLGTFVPPSPAVLDYVERYRGTSGRRRTRGCAADRAGLHARIAVLAGRSDQPGFLVFIDYGYTRDEQLAGRHRGTVRSFRKHTLSDSVYDAPGEQDITADVNFTALAAVAREHRNRAVGAGNAVPVSGRNRRRHAVCDAFSECKLPQEHTKRALQLKHLITPEGMGEAFHVLVMSSRWNRKSPQFERIEVCSRK